MLSLWTYSYSKFVIKIPKQSHEDILSVSLLLTRSKFLYNGQIMAATSHLSKQFLFLGYSFMMIKRSWGSLFQSNKMSPLAIPN